MLVGQLSQGRGVRRFEEALFRYGSLRDNSALKLAFAAPAALRRGRILRRLGRPGEAAEEYRRVLELWEEDGLVWASWPKKSTGVVTSGGPRRSGEVVPNRAGEDRPLRQPLVGFLAGLPCGRSNPSDAMPPAPVDEEEYRRWRDEARRALTAARVQAEAALHNWACFAAEQAAQLGMKALLHGLGRGPWGHDLIGFGARLREAGIEVPAKVEDALRRLGRHYIPARYPDAHAAGAPGRHYGEADVAEAMADATAILDFVDATWDRLRA